MGLFDKAKDLAGENADKVDDALDKAGEMADDKTGGKYTDEIETAVEKAKDVLGD
ncbi:MAG: antitoxin [Actinomycetia bacterium]|nr:antitoxin [Actinomycetes bacterium]MCP4961148.1 antitoxin [Actinomycetes bacterium]